MTIGHEGRTALNADHREHGNGPDTRPDTRVQVGDMPPEAMRVQVLIAQECDLVKDLLLAKNREYGNSALKPINVFSGMDAIEQINVRIDDKLKRIQTIRTLDDVKVPEDTEQDLVGYLILKRVARAIMQNAST